MIGKTVYYERASMMTRETIKGVIIAMNGDKCVVRSREAYQDKAMFILAGTSYHDVDKIVRFDDLIIEDFDDATSYIERIKMLTGVKRTDAKIIDAALRLTLKLVSYGVPLKDEEFEKLGRVYALGYFNNKSLETIKLEEINEALKKDQKKRGKS